jgi:predicted amidohydrolase
MKGSSSLTVSAAQPCTISRDLVGNAQRHADLIRRSRARLVVFPELSLTGYELCVDAITPYDSRWAPIIGACAEVRATALVGAPIAVRDSRFIGVFAIDAGGARLAFRKMSLGGDEPNYFTPGSTPECLVVAGWRIGIGVCKDTRMQHHLDATTRLGIDVYAAGLVEHLRDAEELPTRARRITRTYRLPVVFAGFAGPTGGGFHATSGGSGIWTADGTEQARAGIEPGELVTWTLQQ